MKRRTDDHADRLVSCVFVCTNDRDSAYACCSDVEGEETAEAIKRWLRERDAFWSPVAVSTTSCLGLCSENGAAVTIQPRDEWYSDVRPGTVSDLLEHEFGANAEYIRDE